MLHYCSFKCNVRPPLQANCCLEREQTVSLTYHNDSTVIRFIVPFVRVGQRTAQQLLTFFSAIEPIVCMTLQLFILFFLSSLVCTKNSSHNLLFLCLMELEGRRCFMLIVSREDGDRESFSMKISLG